VNFIFLPASVVGKEKGGRKERGSQRFEGSTKGAEVLFPGSGSSVEKGGGGRGQERSGVVWGGGGGGESFACAILPV